MKKKLTISLIMCIAICFFLSTLVFAIDTEYYNPQKGVGQDASQLTGMAGDILGIIQYVGIIASIIVITIVGIKYMVGSVEQKAEYKKTMIPIVVGCALVMSSSVIVGVIANVMSSEEQTGLSLVEKYIQEDVDLNSLTDNQMQEMYGTYSIGRDITTYMRDKKMSKEEAIDYALTIYSGDKKEFFEEYIERGLLK